MPHPSKRKGNTYERELVAIFEAAGHAAERAWGSDGRALGEAPTVDVVAELQSGRRLTIQAKRRKSVASYLQDEAADVVITRPDRGESLVVVPLDVFLELIA